MKTIKVPYFPVAMKYSAVVGFLASGFLIYQQYWVVAVVLIVICVIVLTTEYVTEIDISRKMITDYISFLWYPLSKDVVKFNSVKKIIITKGDYSQTVNTQAQSRQHNWVDFTASLVFDNDEVFDLVTKTDKRKLVLAIKEFATLFKVYVEDHATNRPYVIDLGKVM